jgi:uncharacterized membrane protein YbhN (UPF0104 family)
LNRKRIRGVIQIAISVALLTIILRQVHWAEVKAALRSIELGWLALAWALFILGVVVRAARWQTLLSALGVRRSLTELSMWYFVGGFFNVVLPTGFGGDAVRVAELAQDTQRLDLAVNSVVVDRYLGLMVLLAMGLIGGLVVPGVASAAVVWVTAALFLAGLIAAVALAMPWWDALAARPGPVGKIVSMLRLPALSEAVRPYGRATLTKALAISLGFNFLQIGWNIAIARGLHIEAPLISFVVFVPLTAVVLLLPAFGGLGVREMTYAGLFSSVGVPQAQAVAMSLGVYAITVATGLLGGLIYLFGGISRARTKAAVTDSDLPVANH